MNKFFILLLIGLGIQSLGISQSNLFVLKFDGNPTVNHENTSKNLTKGTVVQKDTKIILKSDDSVYIINDKGDVFKLNKPGTYNYNDIEKLEPLSSNDSYSKKLMTYFWKEFTNSLSGNSRKTGVVYRGDYVELIAPKDSTSLYSNEINFTWKPKEGKTKPYYFVIREMGSENATMIGIYDNRLSFVVNDTYLKYGKEYEWTIVESKYENLNKVEFSQFKILNNQELKAISAEVEQLTSFLNDLNYEKSEIRAIICDYYKTCL